jgi:hypothetical protein
MKTIHQIADEKLYQAKIYQKHLDLYFSKIKYKDLASIPIKQDGKIFVSIASYRDPQCLSTLQDLLAKAEKPENLVIVVCEQNDIEDGFIDVDSIKTPANIRTLRLSAQEARGPGWARFLIQQLWQGEQYHLQIDSHTRFVEHWDSKCINQLKMAQSETTSPVCLSNYVSIYDIVTGELDKNPLRGPMFIVNTDEQDGFFRINSNYVNSLSKPQKSVGWSGCFSFSSAQIILDAPYDPYLPFLFFGDEMDIFARLYTRGWQMYVPAEPICFTTFDRSYRKTFWEHPDSSKVLPLSQLRLYFRFGLYMQEQQAQLPHEIKTDIKNFLLGTVKTFDEFMSYCLQS